METGIHEYCEEMGVEITRLDPKRVEGYGDAMSPETRQAHTDRRWVVKAFNEGGCNSTEVDLVELLRFVKRDMTELWDSIN